MMRKGSFQDLGVLILILTILVITSFIGAKVYNGFKSAWSNNTNWNLTADEQDILNRGDAAMNIWIGIIPFIIIGCGIVSVILASMIPVHPLFLPISILTWIIYIILAVAFSNFLYEFITGPAIVSIANTYPLLVNVIKFFPHIIAIFGFLLIVVQYGKGGDL